MSEMAENMAMLPMQTWRGFVRAFAGFESSAMSSGARYPW
jgi:hypothetical protein